MKRILDRIKRLELLKNSQREKPVLKEYKQTPEECARVLEILIESGALPPQGKWRKESENRISQGLDINNIGEFDKTNRLLIELAKIEEEGLFNNVIEFPSTNDS